MSGRMKIAWKIFRYLVEDNDIDTVIEWPGNQWRSLEKDREKKT